MRNMLLVIVSVFYSLVSCSHNDGDRDRIVFKNDFDSVQTALLHLNSLLNELPKDSQSPGYSLKDDFLYLNSYKKKKINDSMQIPGFSLDSSHQFFKLIFFLRENFITGAYKPSNSTVWFYIYKRLTDEDFEDYRDIVVSDKKFDTSQVLFDRKILDKKENILLVAPK